jgi:hypothetical protein
MSAYRSHKLRFALIFIALIAVGFVSLFPPRVCVQELLGNSVCCKTNSANATGQSCCAARTKKQVPQKCEDSTPLSSPEKSNPCFSTPEYHVILVHPDTHVDVPLVLATVPSFESAPCANLMVARTSTAAPRQLRSGEQQRMNCVYRI